MLRKPRRSVRFLPVGTILTLGKNEYTLKYIDSESYQFVCGDEFNEECKYLTLDHEEVQELHDRGLMFNVPDDDYWYLQCLILNLAEWKTERAPSLELAESIGSRALELIDKLNKAN